MRKKLFAVILLAAGISIAAVGGVSAYLTDYDTVSNTFTVGKVDIDLTEPSWNADDNKKLEPGKAVVKDPKITNTGINDAFVYMEVSVPRADVETAGANGSRIAKKNQELFTFQPGKSWTNLDSFTKGSNQVYIYAYNKILKPQETTEALFDKLSFINIIEGQLDSQSFEVPVRSYAIQASYTGGDSTDVKERAKTAYEKYLNQNKGQNGQVSEK